MLVLSLAVVLLQSPSCGGEAGRLLAEGARAAAGFDAPTAVRRFEAAGALGCADGRVAAVYLAAIVAAREAYRSGGSVESLEPVRRAEVELQALATRGSGLAELTALLVMAGAAAAQSERGEMALLLAQAQQLERLRLARGDPPVPGISAHELAGDLWLQVHRFETAQMAYREAADLMGATPRALAGLARASDRLNEHAQACESYAALLRMWREPQTPAEVTEAREFLASRCPR